MSYKFHGTLSLYENENNTTFITTAIDYPNALPHIGTAFEKIGADVYARFRRFQGREVYFLMGNDENTVKVLKAAQTDGYSSYKEMTIKAYADRMAERFKEVWKLLNVSFDDFIQTSEERHRIGVQFFINAVAAAGYIERRPYKGLYCEGCEEFKSPNNVVEGKCPNHPNQPLVTREEENYFFLLSKFKQRVYDMVWAAKDCSFWTTMLSVEPESRHNEVLKFIESELEDISISRRNEGWGIPIPWDESQVTYVWFDALLNYLTGIGFGSDWEKFEKYWPAEVHFIGKDITRFHCALFPAMCMAYNEGCERLGDKDHLLKAFPHRVFAHGFIYERKGDEVVKSSKSGKAVNPVDLVEQFGADAYRYYFLSKCNYGSDGEYSVDHFKEVYNADLANNLGNLVSRVVNMVQQYFDGQVLPKRSAVTHVWLTEENLAKYEQHVVQDCNYRQALELVWGIVNQCNVYIDQTKPWALAKSNKELCADTLALLVSGLRIISLLLRPFMPATAKTIYQSFGWPTPWEETKWSMLFDLAQNHYKDMTGLRVATAKFPPLFPRIKDEPAK
jgi:methionyl-tRNA synthetase